MNEYVTCVVCSFVAGLVYVLCVDFFILLFIDSLSFWSILIILEEMELLRTTNNELSFIFNLLLFTLSFFFCLKHVKNIP